MIECGLSMKRRFEKNGEWTEQFRSAWRNPDAEPTDSMGLVTSYANYLATHDRIYGPVLATSDDEAFQAPRTYQIGHAQTRIMDAECRTILTRYVDTLGERPELTFGDLARAITEEQWHGFTANLYRVCDQAWSAFYSDISYVIWSVLIKRDRPDLRIPYSMAWHYDTIMPKRYFKLLIGLNDEHNGGTELLTAEQSEQFTDATGYVGSPPVYRIENDAFAAKAAAPSLFQPTLGDTLLFWPSRVLHRGRMPTQGERLMIFLCACPIPKSLMQHREAITRIALSVAAGVNDGYEVPIWWGR